MQCTDCGSFDIVVNYREGDYTCTKCGLVVKSGIYDDREPLHHEDDNGIQASSRTSYWDGHGSSCLIGGTGTEADKLRRLQRQVIHPSDHRLQRSIHQMNSFNEALGLPDMILDMAKMMYECLLKKEAVPAIQARSNMAGCLYYATIMDKDPKVGRTIKEVERACGITSSHLHSALSNVRRVLSSDSKYAALMIEARPSILASQVSKLALLDLKREDRQLLMRSTQEVAVAVTDLGLTELGDPPHLMSAVIWCQALALGIPLPMEKAFCRLMNMGVSTLKKHVANINSARTRGILR